MRKPPVPNRGLPPNDDLLERITAYVRAYWQTNRDEQLATGLRPVVRVINRPTFPKRDFYPVRGATLRDRRLSPDAGWVLVGLLDRPIDWRVTASGVARDYNFSRDRATRILRELESLGYAEVTRTRNERGHPAVDWIIREIPGIPGPEDDPYDDPEVADQAYENSTDTSVADSEEPADEPADEPVAASDAGVNRPDFQEGSALNPGAGNQGTYIRTEILRTKYVKEAAQRSCGRRDEDQTAQDLKDDPTPCLGADPPAAEDRPTMRKIHQMRRPAADPAPPSHNSAIGLAIHFQREVDAKLGTPALDSTNRKALATNFARWHREGTTWVTIKRMIDAWVGRELRLNRLTVPAWRAFLADRTKVHQRVQRNASTKTPEQDAAWAARLAEQPLNWEVSA